MKRRTKGHTRISISGDTRTDWSGAFALVPSIQVAYVWHASAFTRAVLDGLLRIGFLHHQQIIWHKDRAVLTRTLYWFAHEPCWFVRKKSAPWYGKPGRTLPSGKHRRRSSSWAAAGKTSTIIAGNGCMSRFWARGPRWRWRSRAGGCAVGWTWTPGTWTSWWNVGKRSAGRRRAWKGMAEASLRGPARGAAREAMPERDGPGVPCA